MRLDITNNKEARDMSEIIKNSENQPANTEKDWLSNTDDSNAMPIPEFKDNNSEMTNKQESVNEPKFDPKNTMVMAFRNNNLQLSEFFENHHDMDDVTAIRFSTPIDEHIDKKTRNLAQSAGIKNSELLDAVATKAEKFDDHLYFVGEIKKFEDIKDVFKDPDSAAKDYAGKEFAVSYKDDKTYDVRPLVGECVLHPVKSKKELRQAYEKITRQPFPDSSK